ncbi:long-chain fatty acid--CoA ligase [Methylococcus sp. EFPC2]|uniref:AMP-dependent synthetase/ligase n=1 Tax=Methylococcus sp. EFPC2 TaxID=2812648 RepID=UPI00196824B6|nr:AMP-binding protein [Methylococcus sp. EFPC2]QSA95699.1 AMP-binding protein [Methylococcus sp. EFPC2]
MSFITPNFSGTLPGLLEDRASETPNGVAHWGTDHQGVWRATTWAEYRSKAARLALALRRLGIERGDRVAIMAPPCPAWDVAQLAVLACGAVVVGVDPHESAEAVADILANNHICALIVKDPGMCAKWEGCLQYEPRLLLSMESAGETHTKADKLHFIQDLLSTVSAGQLDQWNLAESDDPAVIVFTSGTTGAPKGILYTHRQICLACRSITAAFHDIGEGSHLVCWLPLSNLFQRMINFSAIVRGASSFFVEDPHQVMNYLGEINPCLFIGVPRFFEKLYTAMLENVARNPRWRRAVVEWSLSFGEHCARTSREGRGLSIFARLVHPLVDKLVLSRFRGILGNNLRYLISGSAPMPPWLLERFHGMGLLILEAYGLSENVIPISANRLDAFKFGTVGKVMDGNEVILSEDGELLVRGPGVFAGYLDDPSRAMFSNGYLASGDYAEIDSEGYVRLTGRKSDIFKTSTGRRVAPAQIEALLLSIPYVETATVFGAGRKFLVALLCLSRAVLESRAKSFGIQVPGDADMFSGEIVRMVVRDVACAVEPLAKHQRPAGIILSGNPLTITGGELTANLKMRRKTIEGNYKSYIDGLYARLEHPESMETVMIESSAIALCSL